MDTMRLEFIGIQKPKHKTGLIVLGIFVVMAGLAYGMQNKIEQRLCLFGASGAQCDAPAWEVENSP